MLWPWNGEVPKCRYRCETREIPEHLVDKGMKTLWQEFDHGRDWDAVPNRDCVETILLKQIYKKYVKVSWKPSFNIFFLLVLTMFSNTTSTFRLFSSLTLHTKFDAYPGGLPQQHMVHMKREMIQMNPWSMLVQYCGNDGKDTMTAFKLSELQFASEEDESYCKTLV